MARCTLVTRRGRTLVLPAMLLLLGAAPAPATLDVHFVDMRNDRGLLRLCLTQAAQHFPDCAKDPAAVTASVRATEHSVHLGPVQPGSYALSVIHDENGNGRLDKTLAIPREGFGFSRNPTIGFGPPKFKSVRIDIGPGASRQDVRMRYLL